ncbi:DeoR/GlpR family DNA-binding transcription regulator [Marinibaculum pumilum]|uniref:DeoR/GlpR family DNA-binding transcription regulator n=1 Tax=Marinibaculum pumilum TaxID=1766165 RepID=A0ABV7LAD7_9PROT
MSSKRERRQREIIARLSEQPGMRVGELSELLSVTTETIRRDLDDLTRQGLLNRTYGGAILTQGGEPALSQRHALLVAERTAIAQAAAPILAGANVLMIGSGATTVHVARRIAMEMSRITVITHSFGVATVLSFNPTITVLMTPGIYHSGEGAMHGAQTARFLQDYRADWAIIGASGLTPDGPSDALIEIAEVYAGMVRQAGRRMVVADASKFDKLFTASYARWSQIDTLVSDRAPKGPLAKALRGSGVEISIAKIL